MSVQWKERLVCKSVSKEVCHFHPPSQAGDLVGTVESKPTFMGMAFSWGTGKAPQVQR